MVKTLVPCNALILCHNALHAVVSFIFSIFSHVLIVLFDTVSLLFHHGSLNSCDTVTLNCFHATIIVKNCPLTVKVLACFFTHHTMCVCAERVVGCVTKSSRIDAKFAPRWRGHFLLSLLFLIFSHLYREPVLLSTNIMLTHAILTSRAGRLRNFPRHRDNCKWSKKWHRARICSAAESNY